MGLTKFSIKHPLFILSLWITIVIFGINSALNLSVDTYPQNETPVVNITTAYPLSNKDQVLHLITEPLENEMKRLTDIDKYISLTKHELSEVTLFLKSNYDKKNLLSKIQFAVDKVRASFPEGISKPVITFETQNQLPFAVLSFKSSQEETKFYHEIKTKIKPLFERIKDVSKVDILGKRETEISVILDSEKMNEREISAQHVAECLMQMGQNIYIGGDSNILIKRKFSTIQDIENVVVNYMSNDKRITIKDISKVIEEMETPDSYTFENGQPCFLMEIYKAADSNALDIQRSISNLASDLQSNVLQIITLWDLGSYVFSIIIDFALTLFWIYVFSFIIIILIFKNLSFILVSCLCIAVSLLGAILFLPMFGFTFNFVTATSLMLAASLVVDDMVVFRESVYRNISKGLSAKDATIQSAKDLGSAIVGTTLSIMIVGCSMFFIEAQGIKSTLFQEIIPLILAMGFSLFETFTLGAIACAFCLAIKKEKNLKPKKSHVQISFLLFYQNILKKCLKWSKTFAVSILLISGLTFYLYNHMPRTLLPPGQSGGVNITFEMADGLSLDHVKNQMCSFTNYLREKYKDIEHIGTYIQKNQAKFYLLLKDEKSRTKPLTEFYLEIYEKVHEIKKQWNINNCTITNQMDNGGFIPYDLYISSFDEKKLKKYHSLIFSQLSKVKEIKNLASSEDFINEETALSLNANSLSKLGLFSHPISKELNILLNGNKCAIFRPDDQYKDIVVKTIKNPDPDTMIEKQAVPNINSYMIPIKFAIDNLETTYGNHILRKNGEEAIHITGDFEITANNPVLYTTNHILKNFPVSQEILLSWSGKSEIFLNVLDQMPKVYFLAFLFIYFVLVVLYESILLPIVILLPLPISIVGSILALWIGGLYANIFSTIGIILSLGVACKNSIILVDIMKNLANQNISLQRVILLGCRKRFRPIMTTSSISFLCVLPMIVSSNEYTYVRVFTGVTVLGGIFTSSLVSLIMVPLFFKVAWHLKQKKTPSTRFSK
jgi:multidrug efflux pump